MYIWLSDDGVFSDLITIVLNISDYSLFSDLIPMILNMKVWLQAPSFEGSVDVNIAARKLRQYYSYSRQAEHLQDVLGLKTVLLVLKTSRTFDKF